MAPLQYPRHSIGQIQQESLSSLLAASDAKLQEVTKFLVNLAVATSHLHYLMKVKPSLLALILQTHLYLVWRNSYAEL